MAPHSEEEIKEKTLFSLAAELGLEELTDIIQTDLGILPSTKTVPQVSALTDFSRLT